MSVAAAPKTVLVADDTAFVRDRFKAAIEGAGHRAVTVESAAELLARVRTELPELDLLVIDLRLPEASGLDIVRSIRNIDEGRVPILVFSGTVRSADEVRDLAALGVAGYVNEYSAVQHIRPTLAPHLFPGTFNRRASPRAPLDVSIAYRVGNTIAAALVLNLSRVGIAIRTTTPLECDACARVRFRLPGSNKDFEADARVCWSDTHIGMGLRFEHIDPADQAAIEEFVDAHFFSRARRDLNRGG